MRVISLQSGSNGNSIYVETGDAKILFDAGISGKQAQLRLAAHGRDIREVDALVISHDHADHVACAGIYQRKFGIGIHATEPTLAAASARRKLGKLSTVNFFRAGQTLRVRGVNIETIPTPHDGADGVGFVVCDGRARLGVLTDLGHAFDELGDVIASLDAVLLESNYDPHMLECGFYPWHLKERIRGLGGHISNYDAAELLARHGGRLRWACLGHLSEDNNTPELALETHAEFGRPGLPVCVAGRYQPTPAMEV